MLLIPRLFLILFFLILAVTPSVFAQQKIESQMKAIENEINQLRSEKFELISPTYFSKATEELENAQADFNKGKDISGIRKKLEKASRYIKLVNEVGTQGKILFQQVLQAREDALVAQASEFAAEVFQKSEKIFENAGKRLEKGDLNDARKEAEKARLSYREAEVLAIKENIVGKVRDLLAEAKEQGVKDYAPLTLAEAQNSYQEVLTILDGDRYAKSNASEIAQRAEYQTRHAMFLTEVLKELKKNDKDWEVALRNIEDRFDQIAQALGFKGHYENGFAETEKDVVLAIQNLKDENKTLKEDLRSLQTETDQLREKIKQYENTVVTELEKKREREEKLQKIEKIFTKDEAQVLLSGNRLIIRLYGLTFRSGTAVIQPEHFMLLTKVMRALREFPNKKIEITGHTDSQGNDAYNLNLSENRAAAIRAYLEANMGFPPDQLTSIGYGERQPIASNETAEGRNLNRRIEVAVELESNNE